MAGYIINYQAEGDQDSPIKNGSVDVFANATQHTLSDLQEGLWYTITMVAKVAEQCSRSCKSHAK